MNFNETSPTLNCGNILPQFLQEKVINLKIGEKTYNQGWGNLTIGRSHFNDVIIKDKSVSAFHANLEVCSRGIFITDHNSTNFTYINNVQIPARERMAVCQGSSQSSVKFGEVFCIIEFQHPTNLPATPERVRHTSSSPEKLNDSVILLDENKEVNNDHAADHHHESREEIDLSSSGVDIENNNDNDNETEETRSKSLNCPQASVDCRRYHDNEDDNKDRVINIIHSLSQNLQINQSNNKDNNDQKEYDGNDDNRLNNEDDDDDDDDHNNNNNEDDDHHNNNEGDDHHKNNNEDDDNNDNKTEAEEEISTRSLVRPQTSVNYRRHHDNEGNRVKKITHRLFVCHEINPSDDESNSDEEEDDNGNDDEDKSDKEEDDNGNDDEDKNYKEEDDNGNNNEDNSDNEDDNGNDNDDTDTNDNITEEEIGSTSSTRTQVSVNHRSYHDNRDQRVLHIVHNVSISLQVSQSNDDNEDDTDNNGDDDEDDVDNNGNGDNDNHKCDEDDGDNNDNNDETYDPDVDEDDSTDDNDSNINDDNDGVHDKSKDSKSESKTKRRYNLRKNTRKYYPK